MNLSPLKLSQASSQFIQLRQNQDLSLTFRLYLNDKSDNPQHEELRQRALQSFEQLELSPQEARMLLKKLDKPQLPFTLATNETREQLLNKAFSCLNKLRTDDESIYFNILSTSKLFQRLLLFLNEIARSGHSQVKLTAAELAADNFAFPSKPRLEEEATEEQKENQLAQTTQRRNHIIKAYEGEWHKGQMHGKGVLTLPTGARYEGSWADGQPNGLGKFTFSNGTVYVGEWRQNKMEGYGTLTTTNGYKYQGQWQNNLKHGQGTLSLSSGEKRQGSWHKDKLTSPATIIAADGQSVYYGFHQNGLKQGYGELEVKKRYSYYGEWDKDLQHGEGLQCYQNGARFEGNWKEGKKAGNGNYFLADGQQFCGKWNKGKSVGFFAFIFDHFLEHNDGSYLDHLEIENYAATDPVLRDQLRTIISSAYRLYRLHQQNSLQIQQLALEHIRDPASPSYHSDDEAVILYKAREKGIAVHLEIVPLANIRSQLIMKIVKCLSGNETPLESVEAWATARNQSLDYLQQLNYNTTTQSAEIDSESAQLIAQNKYILKDNRGPAYPQYL